MGICRDFLNYLRYVVKGSSKQTLSRRLHLFGDLGSDGADVRLRMFDRVSGSIQQKSKTARHALHFRRPGKLATRFACNTIPVIYFTNAKTAHTTA